MAGWLLRFSCQTNPARTRSPCGDGEQDRGVGEVGQFAAPDDSVHQQDQTHDGQCDAHRVNLAGLRVAGVGDQDRHGDQGDHDHGDVHQEDRAPPEVLQEQSAGDRADGDAEADAARPDADGPGLLVAFEDVHQDGEGGGHHEGRTEAHQRPPGDELTGRGGEGGQRGAEAEDQGAREEDLLAADAVAQQTGGEEQPGEDERVGVDRPLQLALGGADAGGGGARDRLDRDVQDRIVQHHDEQAEHEDGEDPPAAAVDRLGNTRHGGRVRSAGRYGHGAILDPFRYETVSYC